MTRLTAEKKNSRGFLASKWMAATLYIIQIVLHVFT